MDVVLECSGATPAVQAAFTVAAPAARIVLVGLGTPAIELPVATIQIKELTVTGHLPLRQRLPGEPSRWLPAGRSTWTAW